MLIKIDHCAEIVFTLRASFRCHNAHFLCCYLYKWPQKKRDRVWTVIARHHWLTANGIEIDWFFYFCNIVRRSLFKEEMRLCRNVGVVRGRCCAGDAVRRSQSVAWVCRHEADEGTGHRRHSSQDRRQWLSYTVNRRLQNDCHNTSSRCARLQAVWELLPSVSIESDFVISVQCRLKICFKLLVPGYRHMTSWAE